MEYMNVLETDCGSGAASWPDSSLGLFGVCVCFCFSCFSVKMKVKSQISTGQKSISYTILYWSQEINSFWMLNQSVIELFWGLNSHIWLCGFFSSPLLIWFPKPLLSLRTRLSFLSPVHSTSAYWGGSNFSSAQRSLYWPVGCFGQC